MNRNLSKLQIQMPLMVFTLWEPSWWLMHVISVGCQSSLVERAQSVIANEETASGKNSLRVNSDVNLILNSFLIKLTVIEYLVLLYDVPRENCTNVRILTHYINREKIQMLMLMKLWVSWKLDLSMLLEKSLHPSLMAMDSAI